MFSYSKRKVIGASLAVVMTLSSLFSLGTTSYAEEKQDLQAVETTVLDVEQVNAAENEIIIHAKGTNLNIYAWIGNTELFGAWPGTAMQADSTMGSGWYTATINDASAQFIINGDFGKTADMKKDAGEYWYVNGTFTTYNPEGPTPVPTEAPTPSPKPLNGLADIASVSPAEGSTFKVNEPATIEAQATGTSDIKFYKYEVKLNGVVVSDYYYSTRDQYTFTPTELGDYTITVYAQAHDMDNTTDSVTLSYKVGTDSNIIGPVVTATPGPNVTETPEPAVTETPGPNVTETPGPNVTETPGPNVTETPGPNVTETPGPNVTETPGPNVTETPGPNVTETPGPNVTASPIPPVTATPIPTQQPTQQPTNRPTQQPTNRPTQQPTNKPTAAPTEKPTATPKPGDDIFYESLKLNRISTDKKSAQKVGSKIKITANASGGQGNYRYTFIAVDANNNINTLSRNSKQNYIYWTPTQAGKYTLKVSVSDQFGNGDIDTKVMNYIINAKSLKINSLKATAKSNKKVQFRASATGGGQKTYRFYALRNGKRLLNRGYSTKNNVTWKLTKKGKYTVYVKVKDKVTGDVKTKKITYRVK